MKKYFIFSPGCLLVFLLLLLVNDVNAQGFQPRRSEASLQIPDKDSIPLNDIIQDTSKVENDSLSPRSQSAIDSRIDYKASDSITFDFRVNKAFLYNQAEINYENIDLTAGKIEVDFIKQEVRAIPLEDSLGNKDQMPHFDDKTQNFDAAEMVYNFKSKKARIKNVVTKENELFVHGQLVKKMPDNVTYVEGARFTACDLEHPHFFIAARRAKIIPDDKVVTGGAVLFLNDIPTPLAVPFALFPNTQKRTSGVIIPAPGESARQGFFLRNGGFYWSINDYMDWKITGDIYSRGDWNVENQIQYRKRYKFSGNFSVDYGIVQEGEKLTSEYRKDQSLRVSWTHSQDPKASRNSSFSANVNYFNQKSQQYNENFDNIFNNQSNSSIAYQVRMADRFNLSLSSNLNFNTNTGRIDANLPTLTFSMDPIYPFKRKNRKGEAKWYESFRINYSMNGSNQASGVDSTFWTKETLENMKNGVRHTASASIDIKLFKKFLNWQNSASYNEYWYFNHIERGFFGTDSLMTLKHQGFSAARNYNFSSSLSTTLYGMLNTKRFFIRAVRHQMSPSIGFSFRPDFYTYRSGYRYYEDGSGRIIRYNIYDGSPAGLASGAKSGNINFNIGNTLEMKVRDRKDTVTGMRKLKIFESVNLSTSYNIAADSLNWAPISLSMRTTLFKRISVSYNATFSLYARDSLGRSINQFAWKENNFLLKQNDNMQLSFSWTLGPKGAKENQDKRDPYALGSPFSDNLQILTDDIDFSVPWSLTLSYSLQYNTVYDRSFIRQYRQTFVQVLNITGDVSLTDKWKIGYQSGFDFTTKKLSTTCFEIKRDLHCWSLNFRWVPFGYYKEWSFVIRANSSMLGDALKYDKHHSYLETDNYK